MERRADDANSADEENQLLPRPAPPQRADLYPTIDGPLGPTLEEAVPRARAYFLFGFLLLPMLWGVNAFYFWPVLRSRPRSGPDPHPFDPIRKWFWIKKVLGYYTIWGRSLSVVDVTDNHPHFLPSVR